MTGFLSNILISDSFAGVVEASPAPSATAGLANFIPLILIFLVFYFLLIRPQQKKLKEHQNVLSTLKSGDKVNTSSGIFGVVRAIDIKENTVDLEIASNVIVKVLKQSISAVIKDQAVEQKSNKKKK
ncbi:MAG: preprotein translocase subunit YajC [Pseudomonadota bacterium]